MRGAPLQSLPPLTHPLTLSPPACPGQSKVNASAAADRVVCSGHGTCTCSGLPINGSTACQCVKNWTGRACDQCAAGYRGGSCDQCAPGYYGQPGNGAPDCHACPDCHHGTCDGSGKVGSYHGTCTCNRGFTGETCRLPSLHWKGWLYIAPAVGALLIALATRIYCRRRRRRRMQAAPKGVGRDSLLANEGGGGGGEGEGEVDDDLSIPLPADADWGAGSYHSSEAGVESQFAATEPSAERRSGRASSRGSGSQRSGRPRRTSGSSGSVLLRSALRRKRRERSASSNSARRVTVVDPAESVMGAAGSDQVVDEDEEEGAVAGVQRPRTEVWGPLPSQGLHAPPGGGGRPFAAAPGEGVGNVATGPLPARPRMELAHMGAAYAAHPGMEDAGEHEEEEEGEGEEGDEGGVWSQYAPYDLARHLARPPGGSEGLDSVQSRWAALVAPPPRPRRGSERSGDTDATMGSEYSR